MTKSLWLAAILSTAVLVGCKSDGPGTGDDTVDPGVDAAPIIPGEWSDLISRAWTVPPGSADTYKCKRIMITQDMWVSGFRAIAPTGTHHTVVTLSQTASPLGDYNCTVGSLDIQMLYASGVGTDELLFPGGVAMKLKAGQYINVNLHLFNASDAEIGGTSGIQVKTMAAAEVVHEADMTFAGTQQINIPSDGQPHDAVGGCATPREYNVFALWPHMHQHAIHQKVVLNPAANPETLLDDAYQFTEQKNYPRAVKTIPKGSRLETTCTYVNNTGVPLMFGDSSNEEMCFTGIYKYPAGGFLFECAIN